MKKYEFALNAELYTLAAVPIRKKQELIRLLIETLKFILSTELKDACHFEKEKKLIVYIDKMSRLFFCLKDKIFSFQLPVRIQTFPEDENKIKIFYKDCFEIDHVVSSILLSLINQPDFWQLKWTDMEERIVAEILEYEQLDSLNENLICDFIRELMFFEPGYLRYDHDIENINGRIHPEHHLHFFFASNNTLRLGLSSKIQEEWLLDMLDVLTECKFIKS